MDSVLDRIVKGFQDELGKDWVITPQHIFDCVYYFICETNGQQFLTHSFGVYNQLDVDRAVSREVGFIKKSLTLKEQDVRRTKKSIGI